MFYGQHRTLLHKERLHITHCTLLNRVTGDCNKNATYLIFVSKIMGFSRLEIEMMVRLKVVEM